MSIQQNKDAIMQQIFQAKSEILDKNKEIEALENKLFGLYGAMETISFFEKQAQSEKVKS